MRELQKSESALVGAAGFWPVVNDDYSVELSTPWVLGVTAGALFSVFAEGLPFVLVTACGVAAIPAFNAIKGSFSSTSDNTADSTEL